MHDALRQLEEIAASSKPPPLVALYRGSPAERKQLLVELEPRLQERGLTVLAFNLLGDALRDIFDPRLRGTASN